MIRILAQFENVHCEQRMPCKRARANAGESIATVLVAAPFSE